MSCPTLKLKHPILRINEILYYNRKGEYYVCVVFASGQMMMTAKARDLKVQIKNDLLGM